MKSLQTLYHERRALGWRAAHALAAARTFQAWDKLDGWTSEQAYSWMDENAPPREYGGGYGPVRLRTVPDDIVSVDDLFGDVYDPVVNPDIPQQRLERERQAELDRIDRDGVWGLIGEYWNGAKWCHADSCFGFIGDDWKDSGYDLDIMRTTLDAYAAHIRECAAELERSRPDMYATA